MCQVTPMSGLTYPNYHVLTPHSSCFTGQIVLYDFDNNTQNIFVLTCFTNHIGPLERRNRYCRT